MPLAKARVKAAELFRVVADGLDPLVLREADAEAQAAKGEEAARHAVTFEQAAEQDIQSHKAGWDNAKHKGQWASTLAAYAYPIFGAKPVGEVGTMDMLATAVAATGEPQAVVTTKKPP